MFFIIFILNESIRIFDYYGILHSTTMSLAICCGLPRDILSQASDLNSTKELSIPSRLKNNSISIIKSLGLNEPNFISTNNGGFTFKNSFIFYAFYQIFSRIVRPIWFREFVTENSNKLGNYQPIVDADILEAILQPLKGLEDVIREFYKEAIQNQIELTSGVSLGGISRQTPTVVQDQNYHMRLARIHENKELNIFYRILTRTSQAIKMMQILYRAHKFQRLKVKWENLKNMTFLKIVIKPDYHDKIKKMLQDLVCHPTTNDSSIDTTDVTSELAENCYFYFSAGDVHYFRGSNFISDAINSPLLSYERDRYTVCAVDEMCKAAKYWKCLTDVKFIEGFVPPLLEICRKLIHLGERGQEGLVSLCMTAAKSFGGDFEQNQLDIKAYGSDLPSWERDLYHGGNIVNESDRIQVIYIFFNNTIITFPFMI
jgi:hypothetical protein